MLTPVRHRQLFVREAINPHAKNDATIFFIHGSMASLEQFSFQVAYFETLFHKTISFDAFGCGKSPRLDDSRESYSTEEHFLDLCFIFNTYKSPTCNVLVGHSFGTSQVLRLAMKFPDKVHAQVLIATAIFPDGGHVLFRLPEFVLRWIQPKLSENFLRLAFHPETRKSRLPHHEQLMRDALTRAGRNDMHVVKSFYTQIQFVKETEVKEKLSPHHLPTLFICGSEDLITPVAMSETMRTWLGEDQTQLEVIGPASHQVMQEQPELTNAAMASFLKALKIPQGG